jgi:oligogalacturonide transport system substrate-binding protein
MESGITPRPQDFNHMDFYSGRAAGLFCWISDTKSYFGANIGVNAESVNISIGDLPYISDDNKTGWYKKPMALYCISKDTKEPENSAKLVNHLLNDEENAALQGTEKGIPLSRSAQEVLAARDMMSELQAVANRKMNGDVYIDIMSPVLENEQLMKNFYAAGDDVTYNNADALKKGEEFSRAAAKVNENAK